jgi:hypothetical protein
VDCVTESLIFIASLFFPIHERSLCAPRLIFCHRESKTEENEKQDRRICWACALMFLTPQWLLYVGLPPVPTFKIKTLNFAHRFYLRVSCDS